MPAVSTHNTTSTDAPKQHNQPSRKGKKAWRKHVDVSDIQASMAAAVEEEIAFGAKLVDKPSHELLIIDTKPSIELAKKFNLKPLAKRLKADEIIAQRSAVAAVASRKRAAPEFVPGMVALKRHKSNWVSAKEVSNLRQIAKRKAPVSIDIVDADYDVWADEDQAARPAVLGRDAECLEFIPEEVKPKPPCTLKHKPISMALDGRSIPAVQKPTGGYSYNPAFNDYQKRYVEESNKVVESARQRLLEQEENEIKRLAAEKSAAEAEAAEARRELDYDTEWEGIESEPEVLIKKQPKRKDPAARNRAKRRKEQERLAKHQAVYLKRDKQAAHVLEIAKEVEEKQRQLALRKAEEEEVGSDVDAVGDDTKLRRRMLGGNARIPDKDMELVLPDELQNSLRLLRPEGNLFKDRYRNILARGKVEPRSRIIQKKKPKYKLTEKWTHKDFKIPGF